MKFPRRPPRLHRVFQSYASPTYFVTFCTYERKAWLAIPEVHEAFVQFAGNAADKFNTAVGRYVIMPDHIHLFVCGPPDFILGKWVGTLKQYLAKSAGKIGRGWNTVAGRLLRSPPP